MASSGREGKILVMVIAGVKGFFTGYRKKKISLDESKRIRKGEEKKTTTSKKKKRRRGDHGVTHTQIQ